MKWEDNIFGKVAKEDWLTIGAQVPTRQNDPVDRLFGDRKTNNIMAYWETIASEYGIPVMAQFHSFDVETQKTFRIPIDTHNIEKGYIKVKIDQTERLRALKNRGVQGDEELYNFVMQDGIRLADQVITRTKVAKNEMLATGQVTIKENNLDLTVDYGVPAAQKAFTLDIAEDADVSAQIQDIVDYATDIGMQINGMVTAKKNISKLRKNATLQTAINGTAGAGALLSSGELENYLDSEFGISTIITNDLKYGASATLGEDDRPVIQQARYYPEDKITFFATNPGGKLGEGLWGDPPEKDEARFFDSARASEVSPYVYITQWIENDPVVLWTRAGSLFIPVLYQPNSLFIASLVEGV